MLRCITNVDVTEKKKSSFIELFCTYRQQVRVIRHEYCDVIT